MINIDDIMKDIDDIRTTNANSDLFNTAKIDIMQINPKGLCIPGTNSTNNKEKKSSKKQNKVQNRNKVKRKRNIILNPKLKKMIAAILMMMEK